MVKLIKNNTNRPNIDLIADSNLFPRHKTLGGQIPIGAGALACEFHRFCRIRCIDNLAETKVSDLGISELIKEYIPRLEVVVDDPLSRLARIWLAEVLHSAQNL